MNSDELRAALLPLLALGDRPDADTIWGRHRADLRQKLASEDPAQFLRWPTVESTMFVGNAPYIDREYAALASSPDWPAWEKAIRDSGFGGAVPYPQGQASGNYIHAAYHLKRFQDAMNRKVIEMGRIVEFGGGYGAMAAVCRQLGFAGLYGIADLPEFSLLQRYYLSNTAGLANVALIPRYPGERVLFGKQPDLLIAAFSLSETTPEDREIFLAGANPGAFLFVFTDAFDGVDNVAWFREFAGRRPEYRWKVFQPPWLDGVYYQVGAR